MRFILTVLIAVAYVTGCHGTSPIGSATAAENAATSVKAAVAVPIAGDAARGKSRSAELFCDACHGTNGNSETEEWPSLAGQSAVYLARQMDLLRSAARPSPEMQPIAATLSDADIADLAVHYSAQSATSAGTGGDVPNAIETLYRNGDSARGIPACSSCHGAEGRGNAASGDPAVRAQQPGYTSRQLEAYAKRTRYAAQTDERNPNLSIMYETAEKLTTEEIRSLAVYLHAMP